MPLRTLDHCSIRTVKLEESRDFYMDALGMADGARRHGHAGGQLSRCEPFLLAGGTHCVRKAPGAVDDARETPSLLGISLEAQFMTQAW